MDGGKESLRLQHTRYLKKALLEEHQLHGKRHTSERREILHLKIDKVTNNTLHQNNEIMTIPSFVHGCLIIYHSL